MALRLLRPVPVPVVAGASPATADVPSCPPGFEREARELLARFLIRRVRLIDEKPPLRSRAVQSHWLAHHLAAPFGADRADDALARFPIRWGDLIDEKSLHPTVLLRSWAIRNHWLAHQLAALFDQDGADDALARFPIRWNHLIEEKSRQSHWLAHHLVALSGSDRADDALARFPISRNHLIDEKSRHSTVLLRSLADESHWLAHRLAALFDPNRADDTLARFPIRWNHLIEEKSRQSLALAHHLVAPSGSDRADDALELGDAATAAATLAMVRARRGERPTRRGPARATFSPSHPTFTRGELSDSLHVPSEPADAVASVRTTAAFGDVRSGVHRGFPGHREDDRFHRPHRAASAPSPTTTRGAASPNGPLRGPRHRRHPASCARPPTGRRNSAPSLAPAPVGNAAMIPLELAGILRACPGGPNEARVLAGAGSLRNAPR